MTRHAQKTPKILDLEKDIVPSPFEEIFKPEAIVELSRKTIAISKATTLSECMPELSRIAREEGLNLNRTKDFLEAKRILFMDKLGKR